MTNATTLFSPLRLAHGPIMRNRLMLAPLTNGQSNADGTASEAERNWLVMRARGGFGLTTTCATHVERTGQAFEGQLGIYSDHHLDGLARIASEIRSHGSLSSVQLHHGGRKASPIVGGVPRSASADEETGARAMTRDEIEVLIENFILAALRADAAGFDGVEVHGAHSYVITQFLSPGLNHRRDCYGGSLENRSRLLFDILGGIRNRCRPDFQLGVRLSPERYGLRLPEMIEVYQQVVHQGMVDYIDLSLWNVKKPPDDPAYRGRSVMSYFTSLDRKGVRLGVAGKIMTPDDAREVISEGSDFAILGRAAILHHDFPQRASSDDQFTPLQLPVSLEHLGAEGLTAPFIKYLRDFRGFLSED
ncbi:MAG: NADH:flavin oxidoreductase [Alphaproteobacteria bacterium]|nr:NADH:flavin oxidoreductase [Alphaproteobacteria bacterium]